MSYADPMQPIIAVGLVSYGKYYVPTIHRMSWAEYVARMEEMIGVYRVLVGKPEGKKPVGRPRRRWKDNIKMTIQEVGWGMDWVDLALNRDRWFAVVKAVMNFRVS
jgi:hypothetical protein